MTKERQSFSRIEIVALTAVVLLAAFLRFHRIDQAEFIWDQAEISKWALRLARLGEVVWVGTPSSTGLYTFMAANWLMAIPFAVSASPIVATAFIALINTMAVLGCYLLARSWFGRYAAFTAALLFAVGPWAVIYSRKVWHAEFLAPFTVLYAFAGWKAYVKGCRWALPIHWLTAAALVQLHFSAFPLVLLTGLWLVLFWKRLDWRVVLASGLLAALTFVPYFVYDAQQDWYSVRMFLETARQPAIVDSEALRYAWTITTGLDLHWLTGSARYPEFVAATPNLRWLFVLEGVLAFGTAVLALTLAIRQVVRRERDDEIAAALMATTWFALPILALTRHNVPNAPHYFTSTLPSQFILIGWLFARVVRLARERVAPSLLYGTLTAVVLVIAAAQIYEVTSVLRFVMTHHLEEGYSTPLSYKVEAAEASLRLARELDGAEVIVLSQGDEPRSYEGPAVADVLFFDVTDIPHRAVDVRTALVFPADPAIYWSTYDLTPAEALLAGFTPELGGERILLREGVDSYRFYRWSGGPPSLPNLQWLSTPARWANGVELVGYVLEGDARPGGTLRWTLVWRATGTPAEDINYHWFNHLLDEGGELRGQRDGPSMLPSYWRAGDTVLNWFEIPIPPDAPAGDYAIRVGMYTYPVIANVPMVDVAGEWVEISPIPVGRGD